MHNHAYFFGLFNVNFTFEKISLSLVDILFFM